jgi:hypothetical protein
LTLRLPADSSSSIYVIHEWHDWWMSDEQWCLGVMINDFWIWWCATEGLTEDMGKCDGGRRRLFLLISLLIPLFSRRNKKLKHLQIRFKIFAYWWAQNFFYPYINYFRQFAIEILFFFQYQIQIYISYTLYYHKNRWKTSRFWRRILAIKNCWYVKKVNIIWIK